MYAIGTTLTAGSQLVLVRFPELVDRGRALLADGNPAGRRLVVSGYLNLGLTVFVLLSVLAVLLTAAARWAGAAVRRSRGSGASVQ